LNLEFENITVEDPSAITLPLAFTYSLSSSGLSGWNETRSSVGLDLGSLVIDTCSSRRSTIDFLSDSESGCYRFQQAERNWTVPGGSTLGYVRAAGVGGDVVDAYLMGDGNVPVVSADASKGGGKEGLNALSTMPGHRATVQVRGFGFLIL